jgi:beta-galactosidase
MGYDTKTLPLKNLTNLAYGNYPIKQNLPYFFRGTFKAKAGVDTFIDTTKLNKGVIFINGFNLGRFWNIGPQYTLYVPGEILKDDNVIEVFEIYSNGKMPEVKGVTEHIFINKEEKTHEFELL